MSNHPNRGWRQRWTIDIIGSTATHDTGLVVKFVPSGDGVLDGMVTTIPESLHDDPKFAARLMSEAGDIYQETLDGRH